MTKSKRQVRFLLSKVSPLSGKQKGKLQKELHTGKVRIKTRQQVKNSIKKQTGYKG